MITAQNIKDWIYCLPLPEVTRKTLDYRFYRWIAEKSLSLMLKDLGSLKFPAHVYLQDHNYNILKNYKSAKEYLYSELCADHCQMLELNYARLLRLTEAIIHNKEEIRYQKSDKLYNLIEE